MTFSDFSITVSKKYFNPKLKKVRILLTFLRLPMHNRTSIQLFLLFNRQSRIQSFGRCEAKRFFHIFPIYKPM